MKPWEIQMSCRHLSGKIQCFVPHFKRCRQKTCLTVIMIEGLSVLQPSQRVLSGQWSHIHTSAGQSRIVLLHICVHPDGSVGYPTLDYVFDMLLVIFIDSVHFTRRWVQYCHSALICQRKSHGCAFFETFKSKKKKN